MGHERLPRKFLACWCPHARPVGRPLLPYGESVTNALKRAAIDPGAWHSVALNKDAWRDEIRELIDPGYRERTAAAKAAMHEHEPCTKIPARKRAREIPTATPTTTAAQRRREPEPLRVRPWLVTERGVQDLHRMPTTKRPGGACLSPRSFPRHALRRRSATSSRCPHLPWWQVPFAGRFPLTDPLMKKRSAEDPRSRRLLRTTQQKMGSEIGEPPLGFYRHHRGHLRALLRMLLPVREENSGVCQGRRASPPRVGCRAPNSLRGLWLFLGGSSWLGLGPLMFGGYQFEQA